MNERVIEKIAEQLGMAVDQAGGFIAQHLPDYAALKVVQLTVPLAAAWGLFAFFAIVALAAIIVCVKIRRRDIIDRGVGLYVHEWSFFVFAIAGIAAIVLLFFAAATTGDNVPDIIGWQSYPEAMLIDMALEAVV